VAVFIEFFANADAPMGHRVGMDLLLAALALIVKTFRSAYF
jgi:hypothetical protein